MNTSVILNNLLSVPVLFFFLGMIASWLKSDLHIPHPLPKLFSLYLLMAIGLHGGYELYKSGFSEEVVNVLGACLLMASFVPVVAFFILRRKFAVEDAAAMAATFGSISAVTFISAMSFLEQNKVPFGGYMVAGMALMESPAIIIGVLFYNIFSKKDDGSKKGKTNWKAVLHDSFFNGSIVLIIGALIIGYLTGEKGHHDMLTWDGIFKGMLAFYLLDNGIEAAQRLRNLEKNITFLVLFSILFPLFNASLGILISHFVLHMDLGSALLFTILCASASYIAVPAAMRLAIPKSNPVYTVPVALGLVFPFNVIVGIPLYYYILQSLA